MTKVDSQNETINTAGEATSFEDFKAALGSASVSYTDEQIEQMRKIFDKLADLAFNEWIHKRNSDIIMENQA